MSEPTMLSQKAMQLKSNDSDVSEGGLSLSPPVFSLMASDADVNSGLQQLKSNGENTVLAPSQMKSQRDGALLRKMGQSMGTDFSNVNIHKDSNKATSMGALAYAQGNDLHFAPGQYNPESTSGQELIGHELAHVQQQRAGRVQPTTSRGDQAINDNAGLEQEADDLGRKAAQFGGDSSSASSRGSGTASGLIQRKAVAQMANPTTEDYEASNTAVANIDLIKQEWASLGDGNKHKLAYILATVEHECGFYSKKEKRQVKTDTDKQKEVKTAQDKYWDTGFYGRGFVQLTWKSNYEKMGAIVGEDLVANPDKAMIPKHAAKITVYGMVNGSFSSGNSLSTYFNDKGNDFVGARRIINGQDSADTIAKKAEAHLTQLQGADGGNAYYGSLMSMHDIQMVLHTEGFLTEAQVDGTGGPTTNGAIKSFKAKYSLPEATSHKIDEKTKAKLLELQTTRIGTGGGPAAAFDPDKFWKDNSADASKVAIAAVKLLPSHSADVQSLLGYLYWLRDDLAFLIGQQMTITQLRGLNKELLTELRTAMDDGWTTYEEYEVMGKIDLALGQNTDDKQTADKRKAQDAADKSTLDAAKKIPNGKTLLSKSVGEKGVNDPKDVKLVLDRMLALQIITPKEHASNDPKVLIGLVYRYQRRIFDTKGDGLISPEGTTANRLQQGVRGVPKSDADRLETILEKERTETQDANKSLKADTGKVNELYAAARGDYAKLGKAMSDYVRTNPELVEVMLDKAGYFYIDDLSFYIVQSADENSLKRANRNLLKRMYTAMDDGNTTKEDYMMMARLEQYMSGKPEEEPVWDFSETKLDVADYWQSQGKTPHCDVYTKKIIDGHKKDHPELYEEFGDIGGSKTTESNSLHIVWEKDHEKGTERTQGTRNANDVSTLEKDEDEWDLAIRYIVACLNAGVPVMVGVNHTFAYSRASANNDKSTDHWLTIIGKGEDENGKYFMYTDPGTSSKSMGTNSDLNRLVQSKDNPHIWRDETKYANSDAGSGSYTLVAVTLYDKHRGKQEFKLGNETFKRKKI